MIYKVFCVVLLFVASGSGKREVVDLPQEYLPDIFKGVSHCVDETGVEPGILAKILRWKFEDSEKVRNFMFCALNKTGYGDEKGHYVTKNMVKLIGNHKLKDEYEKVLDECNKIEGSDVFDTLIKTTYCLRDNTPVWIKL